MLRSIPFHAKALAFSHIAMDASSTRSVNILETFNAYQYGIYKSAPTIPISIDFCDLIKGRLMCIVSCPNIVQFTMCFFCHDPACHTSPSMRHHA